MTQLHNKIKLHFKFPLTYNDGDPVPDKEFVKAKNYFIDTYDGLTIEGRSTGYWKHSSVLYSDETVEYFVMIEKKLFNKRVKQSLPKEINKFKGQFRQLEILCYYYDVMST